VKQGKGVYFNAIINANKPNNSLINNYLKTVERPVIIFPHWASW